MDSQLTLVPATPAHRLLFSTDSMKNTTLLLDGAPAYTISTDSDPNHSRTEIRAASEVQVLARVRRKDVLPNVITFPQVTATEMRLHKWFRKTALPDGSSAHVIDTEYRQFTLKTHPVHRLALFKFREDNLQTPVAHWQRSDGMSSLALGIQAGVPAAARAYILAAFIVWEFKLRMTEKASLIVLGA
ncbi:hypothetical protein B0H17DRAFT_1212148 [Mycena rosella]|uniref:DUF6593 domain-containing protein n=1 Tax=Mycena rosella TaxID=1033263 RepID=A0AAD7CT75_MYCRO|nr:hypothetical protein B0H17DRAFT_1212148 [Mycena rosella]